MELIGSLNIKSQMKQCKICKIYHKATTENFHAHPTASFGLDHRCKDCESQQRKDQRYEAKKKKQSKLRRKQKQHEWYLKNREERIAYAIQYDKDHPEKFKERIKKHHSTDKYKQYQANWRNNNQEYLSEYYTQYWKNIKNENPEFYKAKCKAWAERSKTLYWKRKAEKLQLALQNNF